MTEASEQQQDAAAGQHGPAAHPGEQYTIRRKLLRLFGASFHIFDAHGQVVGFCNQKAFRFREDIRFYTDESKQTELFAMKARSVLDFSTTYDVELPDGTRLGSLRRKGIASSLVRDEWNVFGPPEDPADPASAPQIGVIHEDSVGKALLRRFIELAAVIFPQSFTLARADGTPIAVFRQHFNPFIYRLGIAIDPAFEQDEHFDDLLILAAGCLIAAIEGRQE